MSLSVLLNHSARRLRLHMKNSSPEAVKTFIIITNLQALSEPAGVHAAKQALRLLGFHISPWCIKRLVARWTKKFIYWLLFANVPFLKTEQWESKCMYVCISKNKVGLVAVTVNTKKWPFMILVTCQIHLLMYVFVARCHYIASKTVTEFTCSVCVCVCCHYKQKPSVGRHRRNITVVISPARAVMRSLNGQPWKEPLSASVPQTDSQSVVHFHFELFLTYTHFFWGLNWVTDHTQWLCNNQKQNQSTLTHPHTENKTGIPYRIGSASSPVQNAEL